MKRSLAYLERRRAESRAALEERLGRTADRMAAECERAVDRHPLLSLGAAGLTGWLAGSSIARGGGRAAEGVARAVQRVLLLKQLF